MVKKEKSKLWELIEEYGIKDLNDSAGFCKILQKFTISYSNDR
jgi:hypothetical protein